MIVCGHGIGILWIGIGQLARRVDITVEDVGYGRSTLRTGQIGVEHGLHTVGERRYYTRTSLAQHQHDGLARSGQSLGQRLLVGRYGHVGKVARSLAIRVLAQTQHYAVDVGRSTHRSLDVDIGLVVITSALLVLDTGGIDYIVAAHGTHRVEDRNAVGQHLIDDIALPRVAPTAAQRTQTIGIGTRHEHLGALAERQHGILVLQQRDRLAGGIVACAANLLALKRGIVPDVGIGSVDQTQTQFHTYDARRGIVYALLRHLALLDQLDEQRAEIDVVRDHRHVDAGIYGQTYRILIVYGYLLARI